MKILILANNDIGLYRFRKELIFELLKENEVYISLPYGEMVEPLKSAGCTFIDTPVDRRGMNPFKDYSLYKKYKSILSELDPDLVITYTIKPNIYGGFACRRRKTEYAVNITGLGTAFEKKNLLRILVERMYKIALKESKVVFFENQANKTLFVDENLIDEKQACVLNGAGVNLLDFPYEEYPHNSKMKFLFIGRVMKEKGVEELFAAMKRLVAEGFECCLDVVGPFEENYKDVLDVYQKEGWLKYWGYQKDVRPFIKACDCFVLPSYHEGMANTNLECASSGRLVITSNIPGCKESVIDGISGFLCEPRDEDSLFVLLKKVAQMNRESRITMGEEGRRRMKNEFDKKTVVMKTINELYKYK